MRTTRVLAIIAILGIAFSFRASANVGYDSETTNEWFRVTAAGSGEFPTPTWTKPTDGEVSVVDSKIVLDTDLNDPLIYTPTSATGPVVTVTAQYTAMANATTPDLTDTPQAALAVIANGADTNWFGLVKKNEGAGWEKFTNVIPTVGETYTIHIDLNNETHKIRYWVGDAILGTGWYGNPKSAETKVTSVSFAGTGDIGNFGGDVITENGATFNGTGYATFADALAAAKASSAWADGNPIVLYKNAEYTASETETLYVNPNGKTFTIGGEVAVDVSGNTYGITAGSECEAKIGSKYYSTIENAIVAAQDSETIIVNRPIEKALTFDNTSVRLDTNGKAVTCATLTVANGVTLTLAGGLAVTTATINGAVAGETLTVTGTLTGVNVEKLALGNAAAFAYGDTALGPSTTLTLGTALKIGGLDSAAIDTVVINNAEVSGKSASMFTADPALPEGLMLDVDGNVLKVVKEPPAIEITIDKDTAGFDFTNGTINVNATVKSGKSGTLTLTVVNFDGSVRAAVEKAVTEGTKTVTFDLDDLTAGGTYSYEIVINDGSKDLGTAHGEFTAANWDDDIWFGADASLGEGERVVGGTWATAEPKIENNAYVIEEGSVFNVTKQEQGSNRVTRVDAAVTFESLVDGDVDTPEEGAISGFVATTAGWQALASDGWTILTGVPAPVAGKPYVVRAEVDFISNPKRVRYLVSEDGGATFIPLSNESAQWLVLADTTKSLLEKVELQGSGKVAKFEATVADKAIAVVGDKEYDTMAEALAAAGTEGTNTIKLLTNATVEPKEEGKYEIAPGNYHYVSGGKDSTGNRTIIVDGSGNPPVVRPTDTEMKKVMTPDGKSYKNYDSLRKFLEKNKVDGYTNDNANAESVSNALETVGTNNLQYWQDYALGIDIGTSVAPVTTPAGDTKQNAITLAIPAIDTSKYSPDYTIRYQVMKGGEAVQSEKDDDPRAILIPLKDNCTGTYTIKAVFTPTSVSDQAN